MICKSRTGARKLLAVSAVLAMAFCVFAAAMPADETDGAEVPIYTMTSEDKIIEWNSDGQTEEITLKEAMTKLQNQSINSGTMTFPAGNFDVAWGNDTVMGSAFIINASNVIINGEKDKTLIYCGSVTNGKSSAVEINQTGIRTHSQNAVTVYKDTTMNNLTIMNNIYKADGKLNWYKSVCVDGGDACINYCTLMPNDKVEGIDYSKIVGTPRGGVFIVTNGNMTVENSKLYDGVMNTGWANENSKLTVKNTEIIVDSNTTVGFYNLRWDSAQGKYVEGPLAKAENVTIRVVSEESRMSGIISYAIPGVTIEVESNIGLSSSVSLKEGVELNINKGYSLSIPNGVEFDVSEGSNLNIDGMLNVYGKLASSGTIGGSGSVFADRDSEIPSDLANDITVTHPFVPMPDEDEEFPGYVPSQPSSDDSSEEDSSATQVAIVATAIAIVLVAIIALLYKSR